MENQPQISTNELLDDIRYVNDLNEVEIQRVRNHVNMHVAGSDLPDEKADLLIESVSTLLGQLTAKVKLTEKAVHSLQSKQKTIPKAKAVSETGMNDRQATGQVFTADILEKNVNILPMETSSNGVSFCWSGADPEIQFSFSLDRSKKLEMQIRIFALIKPEYSKQLQIFIDGGPVKHRFALAGSLFVASCLLPASDQKNQTEVKIVLPNTHSPTDLGGNLDGRQLGIAISDIRFGPPVNGFIRLLRFLRLGR